MENNYPEFQCNPDPSFLPQQTRHQTTTSFYPTTHWQHAPGVSPQRRPPPRSPASRKLSPSPILSSSLGHHQPYVVEESAVDPALDSALHSFSGILGDAAGPPDSFAPPIVRWCYDREGPWNHAASLSHLTVPADTRGGIPGLARPSSTPNGLLSSQFAGFRSQPGPDSEIGSHDTAPITSDSGYGTFDCPSVYGSSQDCAELNYQVESMNPFPPPPPTTASAEEPVDIKEPNLIKPHVEKDIKMYSVHSPRKRILEKCKVCGVVPKCPSDFRKHMLKHNKPHRCDAPGCTRKDGFTTINDLHRHQKSVHKIGTELRSYKCASPTCKNRQKIWPRLDNFKQHITRMHPTEDVDEFIKRSHYFSHRSRSPTPRPSALVASSMDTTLAGMDDPAKHPERPFYNSPSLLFMNPDQSAAAPHLSEFEDRRPDFADFAHAQPAGVARPREHPMRSDTVSTASSSRLNTLAEAACGSGVNPPDPSPRPGSSSAPSLTHSRPKETEEECQKRALDRLSSVIADRITRKPKDESLNETILRVLTSATGLPLPAKASGAGGSVSNAAGRLSEPASTDHSSRNPTSENSDDSDEGLDIVSREEVVQGLTAIVAAVNKPKGKKSSLVANRHHLISPSKTKQCQVCHIAFPRNCDLKKHMKRHDRPYGCTYPKCNKIFGSKSDWKRHENSQHFQIETWRCQEQVASYEHSTPSLPGVSIHPNLQCGKLFSRLEHFRIHLKKEHACADDAKVDNELKLRRIGRNGQGRFWCGFCCKIVDLKEKRTAAWDERYNHIDNHFKAGCKSKEWWCMEDRKKKGEVARIMDKRIFADGDDDDDDEPTTDEAVEIDSDSSSSGGESVRDAPVLSGRPNPAVVGLADAPPLPTAADMQRHVPLAEKPQSAGSSRKRHKSRGGDEEDESPQRQRKKYDVVRYCCLCEYGPYEKKLYESCVQCNHQFCTGCPKKRVLREGNEDLSLCINEHLYNQPN